MKKHLMHFLLTAVLSVLTTTALAQVTVKGQLVDADSGEPLIGASITIDGSTQGTVTDLDGYFSLNVANNATLTFRYIGYKDLKQKITARGNSTDIGVIRMASDAVMLSDVTITSSIAIARKTPVAVSTVDPTFIAERLGTQEFPEILKSTPGVHATRDGGGFGDSKITVRGFKQENVAVMINGVPMNGMENNKVYWSNWAGLADVTRSMQTQRGLGASKVASPAVGGSINIITYGAEAQKGGTIYYGMGNDGYNKMLFKVSSGLTKDGWAFSLLGAKSWSDGYVQGTDYTGYNYFLSITKRFNDSHQLSLTAFGAPQEHYQRSSYDGLTIKEWQKVRNYMGGKSPYRYNATYGFDKNGNRRTSAYNEYHKPQISLNHLWQIDHKSSLSTALYMSIGRGNGYSGQGDSSHRSGWYGASNGILNTTYRNLDGTFAYDQIQEMNAESTTGSKMVMSKNKNDHIWYGLLSTYTTKLGEYFDVFGGVDLRYYKGLHTNEIIDLYDGKYFIDSNRAAVKAENYAGAGTNEFKNKKLQVGDIIYRDYDGFVMSEGVFGQVEYNRSKLSAFVSFAGSNTSYWRYDRFYYDEDHAKSGTNNYLGGSVKAGANYNLDKYNNVFVNVGVISRAPMFEAAFINSQNNHALNPDAKNEKIYSFEVGYGFRSRFFNANVNGYFTRWLDKTMYKSSTFTRKDNGTEDRWTINMMGVGSRHMGLEFDFTAKPFQWLDVTGMLSLGDWRWDSNASGYFYDSQGQPLADLQGTLASGVGAPDHAKATYKMNNIHVGGAAQTTAALGLNVRPMEGLRISLDWNFYARNYADFTVDASGLGAGANIELVEPWKIPSYSTFDLSAGYSFDLAGTKATISGNVLNLFNQEYIADAYDGSNHQWDTAYRIFYGIGRTYSVSLKFSF
ncbi:MAG: carboxypeptidase-like regulatory domain-containing protein [Prevotellaceae bacterium]|jgi:outer membrane cobalamin receptor|nr:carboxypeptidase-like regulatory domain-containing protein [Prevotellaceae bacterium]